MKITGLTDIGMMRSENEDSCLYGKFSDRSAWCVVCDGMGGVNGGGIASKLAAETIRDFIVSGFDENLSAPNIKNLLINAVNRANDRVHDYSLEHEGLSGMGTTAEAVIATAGVLHAVHVGDSRVYLKNSSEFMQVTMDHSFVQDLINFGQITPEQAKVHPHRNIITKVLGAHEEIQCDYNWLDFNEGDVALICTDGLTCYADDIQLNDFITNFSGDELVAKLISFANNCGGADNITVVTIENEGDR